ncbi:MAG: hypothetical protein O3B45_03820 [Bacteroidetes bacterium]|jgi:hypothetical protein|nr:hypothetical protein [Bacteroidota bacterium]
MKSILTAGLLMQSFFLLHAQYGDFGLPLQPNDTDAVDDLIYYGELNDMSGGYHVGDTVFNFTVYDFEGNSIELYEELAGDKPVILINGSVSCLRFRNAFNFVENHQEYFVSEFIENTQDLFNYIFIYGIEAHPTDGNCPSNCPNTISTDSTVTQASEYAYRRWSLESWTSAPEFNFPYPLYADNPDNAVYNNFFQRPFGLLGIECDGTVAFRGDWVSYYLMDSNNTTPLLNWQDDYTSCSIDWIEDDDETGGDDDLSDQPTHAFEGPNSGYSNGTESHIPTSFHAFPNPASDYVTLVASSPIGDAVWFNLSGQRIEVKHTLIGQNTWRFDVHSLEPGFYSIRIDGAISRVLIK